ncbi:MAG: hypothetical protein AAB472_02675 [Patescibacteria group bacterium]|mgnify:FL=1
MSDFLQEILDDYATSIPPRPATLEPHGLITMHQYEDIYVELLKRNETVAVGGISIVGAEGTIVPIISILQIVRSEMVGWTLVMNHPYHSSHDFLRVDAIHMPLDVLPFPQTMTYFVGKADARLVDANVPKEDLQSVVAFILAFLSDEGPPKGIDWPMDQI